jgi:hypothetical protein
MGTFSNASAANDYMTGRKPLPTPQGQEIVACRFTIALAAGDLDQNDIGAFAKLPAGCVPVDVLVDATDLDTGLSAAAEVFTVGVMATADATALSTAAADGGGAWGATTAVKTAFQQRITPTLNNMASVTPTATDRLVGVIVTTAPETIAAGTLGLTLLYRAAP